MDPSSSGVEYEGDFENDYRELNGNYPYQLLSPSEKSVRMQQKQRQQVLWTSASGTGPKYPLT
jgi:hypothetical protein